MSDEQNTQRSSLKDKTNAKDYLSRTMSGLALTISILAGSAQAWDVFVVTPREQNERLALRMDTLFLEYNDVLNKLTQSSMSGDPTQQYGVNSEYNAARTNLISELRQAGNSAVDLLDYSDLISAAWALTETESYDASRAYVERAYSIAPDTYSKMTARAVGLRNDFFQSAGENRSEYEAFLTELEMSESNWGYVTFATVTGHYIGGLTHTGQCELAKKTANDLTQRFF